ncbi:hypothetical protein [Sphingosinicella sp. YJ22]|uniref:hypothetical protein n=1 Tax=Sphingosinicella sp. YJ22 TaxID=1104780 RepID=UPI00140AE888|nr:hypothetical protein [Sphingosinicella sp. YJ22]
MRLTARATLVAIALMLSAPAAAQDEPPPASSEIVVTGAREREQQVREFVTALTPAPRTGSIPRFIDEVCPLVVGLVPAQRIAVADRIRAVGGEVGMPVAGANCAPNLFVVVTRDKRAFVETLARRRPESFAMMTALQIRRLARSPGPAVAWQLEGMVDSDGIPLYWDSDLNAYRNQSFDAASRIRATSRLAFDAAILVVETESLDGLTPIQLGDYAAMRLLAKVDPARLPASTPPTILNVLTTPMGSPVPITMTNWDLAFLRGLYGVAPNVYVSGQRSDIARRVLRDVDSAAAQELGED